MLIEDEPKKAKAIINFIKQKGVSENNIIHVKNMTDFSANLSQNIGLFVIDFMLPNSDQSTPSMNGKEILETIIKTGKNSLLLAISSHPENFPGLRSFYEARGCILADYSQKTSWQSTLDHLLTQLRIRPKFDFLVFCALEEERHPYVHLVTDGRRIVRGGVDCYDISIKGKLGSIIILPQMGLVNAAVTASLCIERYCPDLVGMSGICGGFPHKAKLGQLLISSMAYEYQSGKWAADGFKQEPYQVSTDHVTLTKLKTLIGDELLPELETGFRGGKRPATTHVPSIGIFTSGSAVIAHEERLQEIEVIHRKVSALDMEVFAIHRAAQLSPYNPPCICAKTVVDLCGKEKNDDIHLYGSYISAKFMLKAIEDFFTN